MSFGFKFGSTCPDCGSRMVPVTIGKPIMGREVSAIVRCLECVEHLAEWHVFVRMVPVNERHGNTKEPKKVAECGTPSGYYAHLRKGEPRCDACKAAHTAEEKKRIAKRAQQRVGA